MTVNFAEVPRVWAPAAGAAASPSASAIPALADTPAVMRARFIVPLPVAAVTHGGEPIRVTLGGSRSAHRTGLAGAGANNPRWLSCSERMHGCPPVIGA